MKTLGPITQDTAQLMFDTIVSVFEWTGEELIPAERRLVLIRNACRVAMDRACPRTCYIDPEIADQEQEFKNVRLVAGEPVYDIEHQKIADQEFTEFLASPVAMEAVAKMAVEMSPEGFVRLCAAAGDTLVHGAVCARSAGQVVPGSFEVMCAAAALEASAWRAGNLTGAPEFCRLKEEASADFCRELLPAVNP